MSWFANMDWIDYNFLLVILLMVSIAIGDYLKDILSWIKLQWKNAIPLKRLYIIVAGVIGSALFILFISLYYQLINIILGNVRTTISTIDANFALAFLGTVTGGVALFSGFLAILRSEEDNRQNEIANKQNEIAQQQAITSEQGLITDRINKAVENLGKNENGIPVMEVRIGALYALERIAKDSERDHVPIMELFCAYIRTNSPNNDETKKQGKIRVDIQEALTIIGRRETWSKDKSRIQIEQSQGINISLFRCYLERAELQGATLFNTNFFKANLKNAWFDNADINYVRFEEAELEDAKFTGAKTNMAFAFNVDFSKCINLTQKQLDVMYCGKNTKIPKMDGKKKMTRPEHWPEDELSYDDFMESYDEWLKDKRKKEKTK